MLLFLFITILLTVGFVLLQSSSNTKEIAENWPKYRCDPTIMPFASLYGHDTAQNFQFCMKDMFNLQADAALGPFKGILGTFMGSLMAMVQSLMSMRIQVATLVGGVTKITREFQDRITQVMFRTQITASRIRFLMGRLFGVFYAIIYMGLSGVTALNNFGDTFLFKFLDFLCFPPETLVEIDGKPNPVRIDSVKIGDRFKHSDKEITAVFRFHANGQSMVQFPNGLQVSTNHYMKYQGSYIPAVRHPDAKPCDDWSGGYERPLICLNATDHSFSIGGYEFLDFDETDEGDADTMKWVEERLNGASSLQNHKKPKSTLDYSPSISGETRVRMKDKSSRQADQIKLGDTISTGLVVGLIQKRVRNACYLTSRELVGEGSCVWDPEATAWRRAGDILESEHLKKDHIFYSFIVTPTAQIELESGNRIRDYIEVHSPETEYIYAEKISKSGSHA